MVERAQQGLSSFAFMCSLQPLHPALDDLESTTRVGFADRQRHHHAADAIAGLDLQRTVPHRHRHEHVDVDRRFTPFHEPAANAAGHRSEDDVVDRRTDGFADPTHLIQVDGDRPQRATAPDVTIERRARCSRAGTNQLTRRRHRTADAGHQPLRRPHRSRHDVAGDPRWVGELPDDRVHEAGRER